MPYLEEFRTRTANNDFPRFLQIWEEYSNSDSVEPEEFLKILDIILKSDMAASFGKYVETALPLWSTIEDPKGSYQVLRKLIDAQTTNTPLLGELATKALKEKYGTHPQFEQRLRLVGLRGVGNFQRAITNFELLAHMGKGKYVFHTGGWGAGEIMELSLIREQLVIEFENVIGKRDMSFENAFKQLEPLSDDHFLAKRFGDPDQFEAEARKDPVVVVKKLLQDLGPKTASEIKDALCEWVIPEEDWVKWWQNARSKLKKDTMIESPATVKEPFSLRKEEFAHEDRLQSEIVKMKEADAIILATYNFARDFPNVLKKEEVRTPIEEKLRGLLGTELTLAQELQILIVLDQFMDVKVPGRSLEKTIKEIGFGDDVVEQIPIQALKKRFLAAIREMRQDWADLYLQLMLTIPQNPLKDFLFQELAKGETQKQLKKRLEELLEKPGVYPEAFLWYFQRVATQKEEYFSSKRDVCRWLESFLILLHQVENDPKWRDLTKKMVQMIIANRFLIVRQILEGSSLEFANEFLLLVSKCQSFGSHEVKVLRSLVQVAHPSLAKDEGETEQEDNILWTTKEGYLKTQKRVEQIGTVDIVENAREIEAARALGDLRENSEYKFAQERRHRLQGELKMLSDQINRARILTKDDITTGEVCIGSIVDLVNSKGEKITYSILGPWDADPDKHVLSFQSKLAQEVMGCKEGSEFSFRNEHYKVAAIRSYFD